MATYKVIQDIEAEDKLVGPLSLRQFMYAIVVAIVGFIAYQLALIQILLALPLLPVIILFGFLAAPLTKDQPSEIWLYSRIRYFLKPRKRVWDQTGISDLVTITAPKRDETIYTDNLSQTEVKSRLKALADTIDSRGWAVKSLGGGLPAQPYSIDDASDRLLQPSAFASNAPLLDIDDSADVLDERANPIARQFDEMIHASSESHREDLMQRMREAASQPAAQAKGGGQGGTAADYWFLGNPSKPQNLPAGQAAFAGNAVVTPASQPAGKTADNKLTADERALLNKMHVQEQRMDQALGQAPATPPANDHSTQGASRAGTASTRKTSGKRQETSPSGANPDILKLASNDDLNVETIARQAKKAKGGGEDGEVVISLR